jgi:tRNA(Arg) A34 adenosine deaminase TadA
MTDEQHQTGSPNSLTVHDPAFEAAHQAAQKSLSEGGIPIGATLARDGVIIASGHNERVQNGDPIAHGEMSALRAAGRPAEELPGHHAVHHPRPVCHVHRNHHPVQDPPGGGG